MIDESELCDSHSCEGADGKIRPRQTAKATPTTKPKSVYVSAEDIACTGKDVGNFPATSPAAGRVAFETRSFDRGSTYGIPPHLGETKIRHEVPPLLG